MGRLHGNHGNCEIYERGMGAPVFALTGYAAASLGMPRGFVVPLGGGARGANLPQGNATDRFTAGYARQLDGNGGVRVAVAWHNKNGNERKRTETNGEKGMPRYTPRVCCAVGRWGAGGQIYHR